jgi:RNA polymerase sigma-70 factor (ECF subfamily)
MARSGRWLASDDPGEQRRIEAAKLDPRRFGELYEANFERVYAYVMARVRDRSDAQDVTAQVFHDALANLAQYEWRGIPFAAWLYRIAANAIADRAKLGAREQSGDAPDIAVEQDYEQAEERARLFRAVRDLPEDQQKVITMRFVDGRSIREIADALGRSEGAVKQLQFRAVQNLRDRLGVEDA